jgi:hypothetical protein
MAASTTTHSQFNRLFPHLPIGQAVPSRSFTLAQHFGEAGDKLKVGIAGKGDKCGGNSWVQISDVDTHATPTHTFSLVVTDGTTVKTIIHESTAGQAGGVARSSKIPATENGVGFCVPAKNWWYELVCVAAAATEAASGTVVVGIDINGHRDTGDLTE